MEVAPLRGSVKGASAAARQVCKRELRVGHGAGEVDCMAIFNPGNRMTWPQIRQRNEYKGRWVALDHCRYDSRTAQPVEGVVVDVDEDLVELCGRIQDGDNKHCA